MLLGFVTNGATLSSLHVTIGYPETLKREYLRGQSKKEKQDTHPVKNKKENLLFSNDEIKKG